MDVQQLEHFRILAERLHFGEAAEALGISQPALSDQIAKLERALGVPLFDRSGRRVRLTPAGEVYRSDVNKLLADFDAATANARDAHRGQRGKLIVAASSAAMLTDVPDVVRAFRERYAGVTVEVRTMRSREVLAALTDRAAHVGVMRAPAAAGPIESEILREHAFRVILPTAHPAAKHPNVRLADLNGESLILQPRWQVPETYDQVVALCHALGFVPASIVEVTGFESAIGLIRCELGVMVLPGPWEQLFAHPDVTIRLIANSDAWRFPIAAARHRDERSEHVAHFLATAHTTTSL
jgi:DNA-binding transcriptional LysR family regulator